MPLTLIEEGCAPITIVIDDDLLTRLSPDTDIAEMFTTMNRQNRPYDVVFASGRKGQVGWPHQLPLMLAGPARSFELEVKLLVEIDATVRLDAACKTDAASFVKEALSSGRMAVPIVIEVNRDEMFGHMSDIDRALANGDVAELSRRLHGVNINRVEER